MIMATPNQPGFFRRFYEILIAVGQRLQSPLLLALRLYWGWQFHVTGMGKLRHLDKTAEFFKTLHIPYPTFNAALAGGTEFIGGLLLLLGLGSRLVCLPLIFVTIIAYLTAEFDTVKNILTDPDKFVSAAPFLFMLAAMIIFAFGPGAFSLDRLIEKKRATSSRGPAA